jgi:hypothetical protein
MSFNSQTFRLFKNKPSFFGGFGSIFDLTDPRNKFNSSKTDSEADCESIHADWVAIGMDMKEVVNEYDGKIK